MWRGFWLRMPVPPAPVSRKSDLPALQRVREALEGALGITFEAEEGDHFFKSTLLQTLWYGVFSAWVLWAKAESGHK